MPASFPNEIFEPREIENVPGVDYEPTKKTRFYADDLNNSNAEIVSIEETLGENPQGDFETVGERLAGITLVKATPEDVQGFTDDEKYVTVHALYQGNVAYLGDIPFVPPVADGSEIDAGTINNYYASPLALKDSHNVPSVAPGAVDNVLSSDGTDWQSVPPGIYTKVISISSADILALFATPKTLVAAPGAGKILVPIACSFYFKHGATQYVGGGVVRLAWAGSGNSLTTANLVSTTIMQGAVDSFITNLMLAQSEERNSFINTALTLRNQTAAYTTGNGTAKVVITYAVVTL